MSCPAHVNIYIYMYLYSGQVDLSFPCTYLVVDNKLYSLWLCVVPVCPLLDVWGDVVGPQRSASSVIQPSALHVFGGSQ